jgi:hypothetical protein
MDGKKTILLVAMANSIHTARWLAQVNDQEWDIHLFPSLPGAPAHAALEKVTVHHALHQQRITTARAQAGPGGESLARAMHALQQRVFTELLPNWRTRQLARLIRRLRPGVVHSLEIQAAGYLTLAAKEILAGWFPPWIVTNWGSDIYLFGRVKEHQARIRKVLASCDYYSCECERDVALAREFGFAKTVLPVRPNSGGFELDELEPVRRRVPTAARKTIMLRGYQGWAGRALVGLRALERCRDALQGYSVVIYSAAAEVVMAAALFTNRTGIDTTILPAGTPHADILAHHARARISIALSISDAISTSLLEAMVMGSLPIQSSTACVDEWIEHGVGGLIVPPEDPDVVEAAIRTALSDNALVERAASVNWEVARSRLDGAALRRMAVDMYRGIAR